MYHAANEGLSRGTLEKFIREVGELHLQLPTDQYNRPATVHVLNRPQVATGGSTSMLQH